MPVKITEILAHKPGEEFTAEDGNTYKVDATGTAAAQVAKAATVQTSVPTAPALPLGGATAGAGDLLSTAVAQRAQLVAERNSPGTSAETKANIDARIEKLDTQIRLLQPKPETVGPSSSVVVPNPADPSKPSFVQAPPAPAAPARNDSPAESTAAGAAATNAQANQLQAQTAYWNAQIAAGKATQEEAKAAIDNWIKVNIEVPNAVRTQAVGERTGTLDSISKLMPYLHTDSFLSKLGQDNQAVASGSRNVAAYQPSDFQMPLSKVLEALDGISPTATAILHQPIAGANVPTSPFPTAAVGPATNPTPGPVVAPPGSPSNPAPSVPPPAGPPAAAGPNMNDPAVIAAMQAQYRRFTNGPGS